ncbi:hypothetical protein AQUCO_02800094v1 [Aquilegia coerulea]|uniref:NB-ARC domain-containing protein n=1 Tax=Aquilegia coerulea TaxID=218851 RepID=A0A2G5D3V1_AQUCA|nr:hypothetical protein AQUCO_02800094v1 [Aquilegia coerulea]
MSGEIVLFLKTKFIDALQEEGQHPLPLSKVFVSIKTILEEKIRSCMLDHTRDIQMKDSLYKLNDAIIECRMISDNRRKLPHPPYTIKDAYDLYKIRRRLLKLKKILRTVPDASTTSSSSTTVGRQAEQQTPEMSASTVFGFGNRMEEIVTSIQKDSSGGINKVGIVGMGGSGKTTLAHMVFDDDRVKKEFIPRIWVAPNKSDMLSETSTKSIVEYLLKELGEDEDDDNDDDDDDDNDDVQQEEKEEKRNERKKTESTKSLNDLLDRLHKQLSGKKYLLVFDDIWKISDWYESLVNSKNAHLPRGLPKGEGGGIIITSRLAEDVEKMVEDANLHRLLPTSDEDCWSIFMQAITENGISSEHPTLTTMKTEILENCNNLPLAAKTLGKIVSEQIRTQQ